MKTKTTPSKLAIEKAQEMRTNKILGKLTDKHINSIIIIFLIYLTLYATDSFLSALYTSNTEENPLDEDSLTSLRNNAIKIIFTSLFFTFFLSPLTERIINAIFPNGIIGIQENESSNKDYSEEEKIEKIKKIRKFNEFLKFLILNFDLFIFSLIFISNAKLFGKNRDIIKVTQKLLQTFPALARLIDSHFKLTPEEQIALKKASELQEINKTLLEQIKKITNCYKKNGLIVGLEGELSSTSAYFSIKIPPFLKIKGNTTTIILTRQEIISDFLIFLPEVPIVSKSKECINLTSGIEIENTIFEKILKTFEEKVKERLQLKEKAPSKKEQLNKLASFIQKEWNTEFFTIDETIKIEFKLFVRDEQQVNLFLNELRSLYGEEAVSCKDNILSVTGNELAETRKFNKSMNIIQKNIAELSTPPKPTTPVISQNNEIEPTPVSEPLFGKGIHSIFTSTQKRSVTQTTSSTTTASVKWKKLKHQNDVAQSPESLRKLKNYNGEAIYIFFSPQNTGSALYSLHKKFVKGEIDFIGFGKTPGKEGFKFKDTQDRSVIYFKNASSLRPYGTFVDEGENGEKLYYVKKGYYK